MAKHRIPTRRNHALHKQLFRGTHIQRPVKRIAIAANRGGDDHVKEGLGWRDLPALQYLAGAAVVRDVRADVRRLTLGR